MHRYVHTSVMELKGEAVMEGNCVSDWFNVSDELWERLNMAPDYWLVYFQDDVSIVDRASVQECVTEEREENQNPGYTEKEEVQRRDVILVIIGK